MNAQRTKERASLATFSAFLCFAGGLAAAVTGSVLTASTWLWGITPHPVMRGIGTVLLIFTLPLLILAGHCMDWLEREQKKRRGLHVGVSSTTR